MTSIYTLNVLVVGVDALLQAKLHRSLLKQWNHDTELIPDLLSLYTYLMF